MPKKTKSRSQKKSKKTESKTNSNYVMLTDFSEFDPKRLVIDAPKCVKFGGKGSAAVVENFTSEIWYLDGDGDKKKLLYKAPRQTVFFPSWTYPYGKEGGKGEDENKKADPKDRKGLQIGYPLTSLKTAKQPTEEETAFRDFLLALKKRILAFAVKELDREPLLIPPVAENALLAGTSKKGSLDNAMKPFFAFPKTVKEGRDPIESMYVPLQTRGNGEGITCSTIFWEGDEQVNPIQYATDKGDPMRMASMEPVFLQDGIYWGAHGKTSYGFSSKPKLVQAAWEPIEGSQGFSVTERLLPGSGVEKYEKKDKVGFADSDDDDSDSEVKIKKRKAPSKESEDEGDGEDSEEETSSKKDAKKGKAKKAAKGKKGKASKDDDDDDDEEEKPSSKKKGKAKNEDEDSEDEKPARKAKGKKSKKVPEEDEDEEEDEEEEKPVPKKGKKSKDDDDEEDAKPSKKGGKKDAKKGKSSKPVEDDGSE
jgi:hypothetical protein